MTWVIAHRGASGEEKENTLPAFERAIEVGADYVEFDVQASRDGGLVVFHDLSARSPHPPPRSAPRAFAGRAAGGRDPDARGGARADRGSDRRHGRAEEPVALPSPRHRRGGRWNCSARDAVVVSFSRTRDPRNATTAAVVAHRAARRLRDVDRRRGRLRLGGRLRRRPRHRARSRQGPSARSEGARLHGQRADATARAAGARRRRDLQ